MVKGSRVFPGIKDLPAHIHQNFRNEFIRYVIKHVASSKLPWVNPELNSLQSMYNIVYPMYPARVRHSDAVYHPVSRLPSTILQSTDLRWQTITALGLLRNRIATDAITAVQHHLLGVFRAKKLKTIEARAVYIAGLFKSANDHPIIWREYVEGDIPDLTDSLDQYKTVREIVILWSSALLRISHRHAAVASSPIQSWKPSWATIRSPASKRIPLSRTQELETGHLAFLPSRPPL